MEETTNLEIEIVSEVEQENIDISIDEPVEKEENQEKIDIKESILERYAQIHLKNEDGRLVLILPKASSDETSYEWTEIIGGLKYYLKNSGQGFPTGCEVHLQGGERLLDTRQLQSVVEILREAGLELTTVLTHRRQTAVAAATGGYNVVQTGVNDAVREKPFAEPLYLKTTVRSGIEIRHPGTVIVLGDVNPGGSIVADGDILIWGSLRGVAHAGARGDRESVIMALRMEPTQIRIAGSVARAPALSPDRIEPEIACISEKGIRIIGAYNFSKTYSFSDRDGWTEK